MAVNPANLRSIYRSLLRELPPRPVLASPRSPVHTHLRETFSKAPSSPSPTLPGAENHTEALAAQVASYVRSQRMYATLLERYNPGMDMEDEERVRLTARRVGMNLPVMYKKGAE